MARDKKKVGLVMIHGMGDTPRGYYEVFTDKLSRYLGETDWARVAFRSLYYQDILQENQKIILGRMHSQVSWKSLREFVLFAFSDAVSLEYKNEDRNSPYHDTQAMIRRELRALYRQVDEGAPVVLLAYSLGCHVISNYIWDTQQKDSDYGVWFHGRKLKMSRKEEAFVRLKSLQRMFTVGCNIPVFVAGHRRIQPFSKPHRDFEWVNMYDRDDVLGWPLRPLNREYGELVKEDVEVNASQGWLSWLGKSWNPLSHEEYFGNSEVVRRVGEAIREFLE